MRTKSHRLIIYIYIYIYTISFVYIHLFLPTFTVTQTAHNVYTTQTSANMDDLQQDIAKGTVSGESAVQWCQYRN